jgi:hypothetical protein
MNREEFNRLKGKCIILNCGAINLKDRSRSIPATEILRIYGSLRVAKTDSYSPPLGSKLTITTQTQKPAFGTLNLAPESTEFRLEAFCLLPVHFVAIILKMDANIVDW